MQDYLQWRKTRQQDNPPQIPALQTNATQLCFGGSSPYVGFTNLGNTCYINSVLQCLFHSHAVREALKDKEDGDAQLVATQLKNLLSTFEDGIDIPQPLRVNSQKDIIAPRAKYDIIAPHDFIDFVETESQRFNLGMQHDAQEFLSWLLDKSTLGPDLCHAGVEQNDENVVLLDQYAKESTEAGICRAATIDMQKLMRCSLQHNGTRLRHLPSLLVLRVPQFIDEDDMGMFDREWIQPTETTDDVPVCWGDGRFDFSECCADDCANINEATYRIKSYVHYCRKPPMPSDVVSSGHFAAFFIENDTWYHCDDLQARALPVQRDEAPWEFPYVCFFEKVDQAGQQPPQLPPNPVRPGAPVDISSDEATDADEDDAPDEGDEPPKKFTFPDQV